MEIKEEEKDDKTDKDEYITYDNVAIPEIHTHKSKHHEETKHGHDPIDYDNVAIPEIHIRTKMK